MTIRVMHGGLTDQGLVRKQNEDNWAVDPGQGLFIVSDGMGGAFAGALASKIVVETLPVLLKKKMQGIPDMAMPDAAERLIAAIAELSDHVQTETKGEPGLAGMGATVVVALVRLPQVLIGHMGDSRAYLLRGGRLEQLTTDHSIMQLLIDQGEITPEEALAHPSRGQLTRAVGMEGEALPEVRAITLEPGDRLLLCTDGLTGMVSDEIISAILNRDLSPADMCKQLIAAANRAGGNDNITAVIINMLPDGPE